MRAKADIFLLCTLCIFSAAESATPYFTEEPHDQSPAEGNNITLEWKYKFRGNSFHQLSFGNSRKSRIVDNSASDELPFITSSYRGRLLANVTDTYASITFLRVNRNDSTTYTLTVVSSSRESTDSKVEISVEYQPEFTAHSLNVTKPEGDNLTLSCNATGNPTPTISWFIHGFSVDTSVNNSRISFSGNQKHLTITNLRRTDSGNYRCNANNSLGNATSDVATLDVQYKPEITVHPKNETKLEGDNVVFTCKVDGNPVPTISWTRDGSLINNTNNNLTRISLSRDKKPLTITNVNRTNSGKYRCVASNSLGHETSKAASLDVQYHPKITVQLVSVTKTEGDYIVLPCNATGNPVPTISWTRNGYPLDRNVNARISFSGRKQQLIITNVNRTDSGEYRCVASNSLGNDTSNASQVDIQYEPTITAHPQNATKTEGNTVIFSCNVTGNPVPTILWIIRGYPVNTTIKSRIGLSANKNQLTISNVNRVDSGKYRCVASNILGNETSNVATLDVQYKPEITAHPLNETKTEGDNVTFTCDAIGNPVPSISWSRDGSPVETSDNSSMINFSVDKKQFAITNVSKTDSGEYRCVAKNSVGNETSNSTTLDVQYLPEVIVFPEVQTKPEGENVTLSCNVAGNPAPTISWSRNGCPLNTTGRISFLDGKKQLTITNVNRVDSGEYRCVASNSLGNITSNVATLNVQFVPDVTIVGGPEQFPIVDKQILLTCQYDALPPVSEVLWEKDGTVIARNSSVEINDSRVAIPHYNRGQVQLSINATTPQDAGSYTCLVINDIGNSSVTTSMISQATTASILSPATTTLPQTTRPRPRDVDECQAPDLNKCHEKAICKNTLGSYKCTCLNGYSGNGTLCEAPPSIYYVDPPTETGTKENVTLTCHASGLPQPTFTWITPGGHAVNATAPVYKSEVLDDGSENRRGKIVQEDGSLLIFNTRVVDQGFYKCVAINVVGQDNKTVNLTVKGDLVGVDVAITVENEVFDKDLENKSSLRYKKLEEQVKEELTELFKDIEGFEKVVILGFFNGSVKVHFRVVSNVNELKDKDPVAIANKVGETLTNSLKTGGIGNLTVKRLPKFREPPPPPFNVQPADVKQAEAVITWSHPEHYDMYDIRSYSLQVRKLRTKNWTQLTTTRDVSHRLTNLDPDTVYFVRLKSENKYGKGKPSDTGELRTEKVPEGHGLMLALVIIFVLVLIIMGIVTVFVYRRWKKKRSKSEYNIPDVEVIMNPVTAQPTETIPHTSTIQASFPWREIPRDRLTLGQVLGEGEFGMVVKGELTEDDGHITPCAVKKLKDRATESDVKDLKNELDTMVSVGHHPNLVNLIGAFSSEGQLMIVVEFAEHGNLHRYLRDHRKQNYDDMNKYSLEISSAERLRIACDVAEGMKHLATMRWVHRDLAARNVLLGEGMVAKVADFGLTRDLYTYNVYEKKSGGKVPVKWLAVESLEQGLYTSQSDVWSFGILLWEIETGACTPYAGISARRLLPHLKAGNRLEKPHYCSPELYSVMLGCWKANPKNRPTFEQLSDELHQMRTTVTEYLTPVEMEPSNDYLTVIL